MFRYALLFFILISSCQTLSAFADSGTVHVLGNVLSPSCSITGGQNLNIELVDAHRSDLPSVGSYWGQSDEKDITLSCNTGTSVHIRFEGTLAPETSDTSVLKNTGTASGIGIQLIDLHDGNNHPINMDYRWTPITDSAVTASIPIAARYYRIGDLAVGSVQADATYTLDYD